MKPQHNHVPHRAEISSRRRALFPCDENSADSDLACISPLNFDDDTCPKPDRVFSLRESVDDYDIIGLVEQKSAFNTPKSAPCLDVITPISHVTDDSSPTQKLKTPHDTATNTTLPKLTRKTDTITAPAPDSDVNRSKVRTALFPEMPLSSQIFYPKTRAEVAYSVIKARDRSQDIVKKRERKSYLCNRQSRRRSGQINAGVRHKIKKVKRVKKLRKGDLLQAAINITEKSPLNSVFNDSQNPTCADEVMQESSSSGEEQEPEVVDSSKKFFKSSRPKGVFTVNQNIKLEVNKGKISVMNGKTRKTSLKRRNKEAEERQDSTKKAKLTSDFEPEWADNALISTQEISGIINSLEDKENAEAARDSAVLMSPTSQMCNMTSDLALNSPKKARNLNTVLENMGGEQKKLFPVFYPGKTVFPAKNDSPKNAAKKFNKGLAKDQMLLDAGQKRWGVTQCPECKIVYHMGDPSDEIMHLNYHNAGNIFRFNGWKNERVVSSDLIDGKIIQIVPTDSKLWWKKVKDVMEVVNRDLGFYEMNFNLVNSQVFLYVKSRVIVGVLVAESKTVAHKLLTTEKDQVDLCSEESYLIKCGVSRIWVSQNHRKKGIATALMDSLKRNFMFGCILRNEEVAFSSPTEMGKIFGRKYFKTPNFLIYFV